MLIDENLHSQGMHLIILLAVKEMMLAGISKDIIRSIREKLEIEKKELLEKFDK